MAVSPKRKAARRPAPRTIPIVLDGEYEGWEATARADFPARLLDELNSGNSERAYTALDQVVIDHNFPDAETGEVATSLRDVEWAAVKKFSDAFVEGLGNLPNR